MSEHSVHLLLKQHEDDTRQMGILMLRNHKYERLINHLAHIILENKHSSDNDRDEAEEAIELVLPYL